MSDWRDKVPQTLLSKYEIYNFNHAIEVLSEAYPIEYAEIIEALESFTLSISDIVVGGGSESAIPKKLSAYLHPREWYEVKLQVIFL